MSASIGDQRAELEQLADRRDWTVTRVYQDADAPAGDLDAREQWADLLYDADQGRFTVVLAYDASRLWRDVELKAVTCRVLAAAGVTTVATIGADIPTDGTDDPEGELVGNLLASVAEYDNKMRAKKTRVARSRAARQGAPWTGRRAYGYTPDRSSIIDDEAARIRGAAKAVIAGTPVNAIVDEWNRNNVPTASGNGTWTRQTLTRLLRSPGLAGIRVHRGDEYPGTWQPILTPVEHAQTLAALDSRKRAHGGPGTPRLLTSTGLARCGRCGNALNAATAPNGRRQYRCRPTPGTSRCGGLAVMAHHLEGEVAGRVLHALFADGGLEVHLKAAADVDERVKEAHDTLAGMPERRERVGRLFARVGDEQTARAALDELDELEADAKRVLDRADSGADVLIEAARDPDGWWQRARMLERRRLLEVVVDRVVVHPAGDRAGFEWDPDRVEVVWKA